MEIEEKWYFSKEQLANSPSRKCGYDVDRELSCRQQAANFIQDMGQRLQVTQLCINTAIVYMHRFYVFHSFSHFHRNAIATAALFLAAKVEEQPRKLEHVMKVAHSMAYLEQAQDLVMNENVLLQTLGFDVAIDHPHTHVVRCCHLVKASKDLAQTSYFMASNSLHLTTMCLQYKPTVVACFCIHLACKWSNWEIPLSNESKSWFWYVDKSVTQELLEQLTDEFLRIFEKCPSRLKRKITTYQNMSGYHMGSNELSTKRLPGAELQQGVSFQQPYVRSRPLNEENRKRLEGLLPPNHRPPVPVADFKKQPPPPPPPAHSQQMPSGIPFNVNQTFHMGPSTSQASGSHQSMGAQFLYPMPIAAVPVNVMGPPMSMPHMTNPMLNIRVPPPPPPLQAASAQKHSLRPEPTFPPPKRSSGHSSTRSHSIKTEPHSSTQQPPKAHSLSHHGPRNGTEHMTVPQQPQIKTEMKYQQPSEKHTSHHKGHSKYESSRSQSSSVGWGGLNDGSGRSTAVEYKHSKADNYHMMMPMITNIKQDPAPPLPPPPLPPPPPPPPPVVPPPPSTKPSSIFSPHKMTPPLPLSPPRDIKPIVLSPMLLSPLTPHKGGRNRTSSSSSEPELIPVMPKLEDISGFESIAKGKTAIKLPTKVPDISHNPKEKRKESLTTNVIKEVKQEPIQNTRSADITVKTFESEPIELADSPPPVTTKREHKKKKKHKEHREHREHKDKDKDKEKKKDKHKEKHRDKERNKGKEREKTREDPAPIKITIPKDKIGKMIPPPIPIRTEQNASLKIKIPKDKLVTPQVEQQNWFPPSNSLKIKISKDMLMPAPPPASKSSSSSSSSRKRERSSHKNEDGRYSHPHTSKHAKMSKSNGNYRSSEGDYYE